MINGSGIGLVSEMEKLKYINDYHCGDDLTVVPSSFILPKGSPLQVYQSLSASFKQTNTHSFLFCQDILKLDILWLQDTGILKKIKSDELNAPNHVPQPKLKINQALSILQLATVFFWLVSGIVISIVVFLLEVLCGKKAKAEGTRNQQVAWDAPDRDPHERKMNKAITKEQDITEYHSTRRSDEAL